MTLTIALFVGVLIAVSGMAGLTLQRLLPEGHTAERSRDMIGGVVGLLTLLLALVLGLLIWTAYGVFSTQQTELQTIAARALEFDLEMRQYGPEGDKAREILTDALVGEIAPALFETADMRAGVDGLIEHGPRQFAQVRSSGSLVI